MSALIKHEELSELRSLFVGRKVERVEGDTFILDNGVSAAIMPDAGCDCGEGSFSLDFITDFAHVITAVDVQHTGNERNEDVYSLFFYSEGIKTEVSAVSGEDVPYYGSGFSVLVKLP